MGKNLNAAVIFRPILHPKAKKSETVMKRISTTLVLFWMVLSGFGQNPAIQVEKIGSGKPIIYLPGFITPGSVWHHQDYGRRYQGEF
jgi:hypothetical protein